VPVIAAAVTVADQFSKTWALHQAYPARHVVWTLWFDLTFNTGAAFGLGHGVTPVVEAGVFVVVAGLVLLGRRAALGASWAVAIGLGLILGGAAGNLADRFFRHIPGHPGAVIDFIAAARVGQHDWWPVFNVADSSIVVGVAVIVVFYALGKRAGE
jgi:signal peptidase II